MSGADPEVRELRLGWLEERVDGLQRRLEELPQTREMIARLDERIAALTLGFERFVRQHEIRAQRRLSVRVAGWGWAIAILLGASAIITNIVLR